MPFRILRVHDIITEQNGGHIHAKKKVHSRIQDQGRPVDTARRQRIRTTRPTGGSDFLINEKYTASGAQPTAILKEAIEKILAEEKTATGTLNGMVCGPGGCEFAG